MNQDISVAYFCMEFALQDDFHIYSGGLGVLAGDFLLESDQHQNSITVNGIGLLYASAYSQIINDEGHTTDQMDLINPIELGLEQVMDKDGKILKIRLPFKGRTLHIQAWRKSLQKTCLYLLDTNIPENEDWLQKITDQLYQGEKDHRIAQEFVLGIGGMKLLEALGITPNFIHMNEGHAAFCSIEHSVQVSKNNQISFQDALINTRKNRVYTNHTIIPAGNDIFDPQLVREALQDYAIENSISIEEIISLGLSKDQSAFSMTFLGFRTAGKTNAVSVYHAQKARELWPEYPMTPVTNGIFLPRWYSREKAAAWSLNEKSPTDQVSFWHAHQESKEKLLEFVLHKTGRIISTESLIITWARRFVDYKRPEALFWRLDWLEHILQSSSIPVCILFSGKGHPRDGYASQMVQRVIDITKKPEFSHSIHYIPDYNLEVAEQLVQGSDVWLNTPIEGYEACGTSGMKAGLNGALQCSTSDGWVREVSWKDIGWVLDSNHISESLYSVLEHEILPLFAQRNNQGIPVQWIERMVDTAQIIRTQYSATRMLAEYTEKLYSA